MAEFISHSQLETEEVGRKLAEKLPGGSVVAMYGDLGAGKTAFVRGMAKGMGLSCRVSSPTFTIVNEYPGRIPLYHFDMYRLADSDALFDIGWEDYLAGGGVCAVEWSEQLEDAMPPESVRVSFQRRPEADDWRTITIEGGEKP